MSCPGYSEILDLQETFHAPIGKFIMEFGYLEHHIDDAIKTLLLLKGKHGDAIVSQIISLRTKANIYEQLCHTLVKNESLRADATSYAEKIKAANTFRNSLVHGPWNSFFIEERRWQKISINPQNFKPRVFEFTVQDIIDQTNGVVGLSAEITNFAGSIVSIYSADRERPAS
jgi:hypothetical protein